MSKSKAWREGSNHGFKGPSTSEADNPYPKFSAEYWDWHDGYIHGRRCEILT